MYHYGKLLGCSKVDVVRDRYCRQVVKHHHEYRWDQIRQQMHIIGHLKYLWNIGFEYKLNIGFEYSHHYLVYFTVAQCGRFGHYSLPIYRLWSVWQRTRLSRTSADIGQYYRTSVHTVSFNFKFHTVIFSYVAFRTTQPNVPTLRWSRCGSAQSTVTMLCLEPENSG